MKDVITNHVPEKTKRYSVSRKGMGGRKPKYTAEFLNTLVEKKKNEGVSIKEQCRVLGLPYISVYMAMKRLGIDNPRKVDTKSAPVVLMAEGRNEYPGS